MKNIKLAQLLASKRIFSRRKAEQAIVNGLVKVNGVKIETDKPLVFVGEEDKIQVFGHGYVSARNKVVETKLYACNKLGGELISYNDPQGRRTMFDRLKLMGVPRNLIPVGRLDYKTEGLILLTNNGQLARELELPENGLVRKYHAQVWTPSAEVNEKDIARLQRTQGMILDEVQLRPMKVKVMSEKKGTHTKWVEVSVTEGKYREVRRALESINMIVKRLIRTEFGPFKLEKVKKGHVVEIKTIPDKIQQFMDPVYEKN